jgi:hypothetical protein
MDSSEFSLKSLRGAGRSSTLTLPVLSKGHFHIAFLRRNISKRGAIDVIDCDQALFDVPLFWLPLLCQISHCSVLPDYDRLQMVLSSAVCFPFRPCWCLLSTINNSVFSFLSGNKHENLPCFQHFATGV